MTKDLAALLARWVLQPALVLLMFGLLVGSCSPAPAFAHTEAVCL